MGALKRGKQDGRSSDITFSWFTNKNGDKWEQWRAYAEEWTTLQNKNLHNKRSAVATFLENYLQKHVNYASNIKLFFMGCRGHLCSSEEFLATHAHLSADKRTLNLNYCVNFIDWLIKTHFSEPNDHGKMEPLVTNPLRRVKRPAAVSETVRNPLPYRYVQELRHILCPDPQAGDFRDWTWAQQQTGRGRVGGDWFEILPELIDKNDPDCVWRSKIVSRKGKKVTLHQIWSPVKAMVLLIKLHLPLRTYQVRMLDSGEADTWRYENGNWVINKKHEFALGTEKRPYATGVFKRIFDSYLGIISTGLYINTNKTSDRNKDDIDKGYTIPWENQIVLRWLEKLRNWQEKYNPISEPTNCITLEPKHTQDLKSKTALQKLGDICFLFRDAKAKGGDRIKPITGTSIGRFWYQLLFQLECNVADRGETLKNGGRLRFVDEYLDKPHIIHHLKSKTLFPLHSLRVSLITAYALYTELPLPVISKLLAGHSRLLMTIYYTKVTPSVMAEKMEQAHQQLESNEPESLRCFLADAELQQIQCKTVYLDDDTMQVALANRNPVGWENRHIGLCLVGGNTVKSDEISTLGGCWNGGEAIKDSKYVHNRAYSSVPHGPENCVRCRWFITDARYLPALNAHLNFISYRATEAANLALEIEGELEALRDEQYFAQEQGNPFTENDKLQKLQRRYEKQIVEADEYAKDLRATFRLILRIMQIEENREEDDAKDKLIAVGSAEDLSFRLKFVDTKSELLQLAMICDDAEFYPELQDELRQTPGIHKRSQQLNRILMKKGFAPIFLQMDEKQQLVAGNAMLRQMAKQANPADKLEGYRQVIDYLEAEEYLTDQKLLDKGIDALAQKTVLYLSDFSDSPKLLEAG